MKRVRVWAVVCALAAIFLAGTIVEHGGNVAAAANETRLMRYPDVSKDSIVFDYAGDLWTAPRNGGTARKLTNHPGDELFPKFSPDGKWIAFTGEYDGNADVYVIPAEGGEPRRLTFHPGGDTVLGWTPDGKKVLFRSARISQPPSFTRLFTVPVEGGQAEVLAVPRASLASLSPDGNRVAFNSTSQENRTWKRYRGGWINYIGIFDLRDKSYSELPRTNTLDQFPMWSGNDIFFISDRTGTMNLYKYGVSDKRTTKLTDYKEYDIKWPSLGSGAIAYENGGRIFLFEIASGQAKPVPVTVSSDLTLTRPTLKNVSNNITAFALSPSAARAVFGARGEIFTLPAENGSPRNLTNSSGVHELNPEWSPDGKWIAYLSDRTGEYEIYIRPQMGGDEVRITTDGNMYRFGPTWSPDSKKLLYWDKANRIWYVDIDQKQPVQMDQDEYNNLNGGDWSPDSKWVTYSKTGRNLINAIYLYSLDQKKVFPVTDGFYNDNNPVFDQNGKYLYFLSQRFFHPAGDTFDNRFGYYNTTGVFAVTLKADEASPFSPRSDEEKVEEKKEGAADAAKPAAPPAPGAQPPADTAPPQTAPQQPPAGAAQPAGQQPPAGQPPATPPAAAKKEEPKPIAVDTDGIGRRIVQAPIPPGTYGSLRARKDKFFYISIPFEVLQAGQPQPTPSPATLYIFDIKTRTTQQLLQGIGGYDLDKEGKKVIYSSRGTYGIADVAPGRARVGDGRLNTQQLQALVNPREEWQQLFREAWRIQRDFFWDPNMGGLDWKAIGARYEALLPYVAHRSDLNYIIGEMIAELSTSHTYVQGGEFPPRPLIGVGMLGVDFVADGGYYKLAKIYTDQGWSPVVTAPLGQAGLKVKEGNYLIAVNGVEAKSPADPYSYFQNLAAQVVTLKINDKPSAQGAWEVIVQPNPNEGGLRYMDWVEGRRKYVAEKTGGRAGYMHVPDTQIFGLQMFDRYLTAQAGMDAMVVDERYNGGGFLPDFYTDKLRRKLLNLIAPREGKDVPWPPIAIYGPKVMLINELAGSGGDAFPWMFKREKIGPLVGTRTWGGLVGISRSIPMLDGGAVTAPEVAFWSPDNGGEWIVENVGVAPDYEVADRPDLAAKGLDPQLDKAIELIMEGLKSYQPPPKRPKFPVQSERKK